eukprot:TRINITY_DN509_c0_g1_i2.p1 TRINITY_DN509_c0_g1~~TRINITY_DN509_c0_g1_i2.p1  ORF type:complete len:1113 (+),score=278.26 TRINITY_DN509_c0_g1_i2:813-4151(+)
MCRPQLAMARAISQLNKDAASSCDGGGADSNGAGSGRRSTDSSHSTSSAAVVETDPAGASAGHTQAGALDTDAESDAAADEPADADGTTVTGEDTTYHRVCGPQQEFMEQHLQRARNGALASWPSFTVEPPNPMTMKAAGGAGGFCVRTTHFWAPHVFFRDQGIPQQPPCPVHGWEAVEARSIRSKGWSSVSKSRRVSGLGHDEFMLGTKHCCAMCKRAQDDAVRAAAAAAQTQEERESAVRAAKRQHSYCFMSYDPAVTRAYFARYPWGAMVMPAVICSSRTAITHELAHIIQRACVSGSNPTEIANKLAELKAQAFDRARLAYYSFQLWRRGRSQQTIEDTLQRAAGSGGPAQLTEEEYGLMSPSHALVRKWFMDMAASKQDYQFCWRQQHIGGDIIQVDHTLKTFRGSNIQSVKLLNNRLTVWSSSMNCPLLSINTETTSLGDGAAVLGCSALRTVYSDGRAPISLAYLDNPHRDEKGLVRLFPSLSRGGTDATAEVQSGAGGEFDGGSASSGGGSCGSGDEPSITALPLELEQELLDTELDESSSTTDTQCGASPPDLPATALGDERSEGTDNAAGGDVMSSAASAAANFTLLQAAERFVREYAASGSGEPAHLPSALSRMDRKALHSLAESLGLSHSSEGEAHERHLVVGPGAAGGAAVGQSCSSASDGCDPHWTTLRIKYDPRHWMSNFFIMAHSKESCLFKYFCTAVSEALFQVLPGERERVSQHLRALGMSDEQIKLVPRKYWRQHCRYVIPSPEVLCPRLHAVYNFFKDLMDPTHSRPFFNSDHAKRFLNQMKYVKAGFLSDPPGVCMYVKIKTLTTGLAIFRCLRTTSALEGYHVHLRQICIAGATAASPPWLESITNAFDFRWCVKALLRVGLLPAWVKHFDFELYDCIHKVCTALYGDGNRVLPGHAVTRDASVVLRHGMHFALEHQRQQQSLPNTGAPTVPSMGCSRSDTAAWTLLQRHRYEQLQRQLRDAPLQGVLPPAGRPASEGAPSVDSNDSLTPAQMPLPAALIAGLHAAPMQLHTHTGASSTAAGGLAVSSEMQAGNRSKRPVDAALAESRKAQRRAYQRDWVRNKRAQGKAAAAAGAPGGGSDGGRGGGGDD